MAQLGFHTSRPQEVLDREYLPLRATLLDLAALLDRIDRAASIPSDVPPETGSSATDPRLAQLRTAVEILAEAGPGRAERIQRLFSLPYHSDWRQTFGIERSP